MQPTDKVLQGPDLSFLYTFLALVATKLSIQELKERKYNAIHAP
jgi:hypothetical protein